MGLIILIVILVLVFGGGGGYYGYNRWGYAGGGGIGLGTILLILLVCWLLGVFHSKEMRARLGFGRQSLDCRLRFVDSQVFRRGGRPGKYKFTRSWY